MVDQPRLIVSIDCLLPVNYTHLKAMQVRFSWSFFDSLPTSRYFRWPVVSNISPQNGSAQGGTVVTITGGPFSHSAWNPLVVNIADQPCTILDVDSTTIQCETSSISSLNDDHHHGTSSTLWDSHWIDVSCIDRWTRLASFFWECLHESCKIADCFIQWWLNEKFLRLEQLD